jgi:selenocysteine lyase/cysteine desulfurase
MGTGGLILGRRVDERRIEPLLRGGTGSRSEHEVQPDFLPDMFESGTPNGVGLAGLGAGVRWVLERGVDAIRAQEVALTEALIGGLRAIPSAGSRQRPSAGSAEHPERSGRAGQGCGVIVYGPLDAEFQTATISFNIAGITPSEVGLRLDDEYGVLCRVGLHCAPAAHKTIGTFPTGTVRFGLSAFNTMDEVEAALTAIAALVKTAI